MIEPIELPEPNTKGAISLEEAIVTRRSVRRFSSQPLTPSQISQLLWAAQGLTNTMDLRTAPSAGARYALEIYLIDPFVIYDRRIDIHRWAWTGSDMKTHNILLKQYT
jgi:hypothetical protein